MNLRALQKADWFVGLFLSVLLAPITRGLGIILRRRHEFRPNDTIVVMKLLGGGNFGLAMPMLLGIRKALPEAKLIAVVTPATMEFARAIGVFDSFRLIDIRSPLLLLRSALGTLLSLFRTDVMIDLEIHSKLSTCFSLFTCARNRLGFFTNDFFLREYLYTHLVFFNSRAPRSALFERFATMLGAHSATHAECETHLKRVLKVNVERTRRIGIGVGCSDLGHVRKLNSEQWVDVLRKEDATAQGAELLFLGSQSDWKLAQEIADTLRKCDPAVNIENLCGVRSLDESLYLLATCSHFYAIDSGLLHFARLLNVPSTSFWGPTDPATLLSPLPGYSETIRYKPLLCSPCIHVAEEAPCRGRNLCMAGLFEPDPISEREVLANITIGPGEKSTGRSSVLCERKAGA